MPISGRLTARSKVKVACLYFAFICTLVFNVFAVYSYYIAPFVDDPFYRSEAFRRYMWTKQTWFTLFSIIFVYLNVCLYVCSGFILISPVIQFIWPRIQGVLPWRLRRRTWCFCNCSYKTLVRILTDIHNTQCNTIPQTEETLDDTTKQYIRLIQQSCQRGLNCPDLKIHLVGSSAEGLGRPYALELQKGYLDPTSKLALRFFCCCLPCSTAYSSLRTDYDIILKNERHVEKYEPIFRIEPSCSGMSGFLKLRITTGANRFHACARSKDGEQYLSSSLVRKAIRESIESTSESQLPASRIFGPFKHMPIIELEEKGPAVKLATYPLGQAWYWNEDQRFVTFDFVFGFHCLMPFPDSTKSWIKRPRLWPQPDEVKVIYEDGFILVPKAANSDNVTHDENEWHITFPHSEGRILRKAPKVAKACYLATKLILKNHLVFYWEEFKTYYLKTMFLWELEKHPESFWCLDNVDQCFFALFDHVVDSVTSKTCPHYWIEGVDFFKDSNAQSDLVVLSGVLKTIRKNPAPYIEDIGSMWC